MEFITALDQVCDIEEADAAQAIPLDPNIIETIAAEFGAQASSARDLFKLRKRMSLDDFRDWVNALGYLQMLQNAFAHGVFEKAGGLWKQALV